MEHFVAVFKLDLTEEMTQLQEGKAVASSCLILATPMGSGNNSVHIVPFEVCNSHFSDVQYRV